MDNNSDKAVLFSRLVVGRPSSVMVQICFTGLQCLSVFRFVSRFLVVGLWLLVVDVEVSRCLVVLFWLVGAQKYMLWLETALCFNGADCESRVLVFVCVFHR